VSYSNKLAMVRNQIIMYMNDTLFKQHLSKIARWFTPYLKDGAVGLKKPPVNADKDLLNPTLGPVIEELITTPSPCDWCGKIVTQEATYQRVLPRPNEPKLSKSIWISHCKTCGLYKNPRTDQMQRHFPTEVPNPKTWSKKRRDNFQQNRQ
jgi:hypothetical protein